MLKATEIPTLKLKLNKTSHPVKKVQVQTCLRRKASVMKHKLKFRVSGNGLDSGAPSKKFSINIDESQPIILGKYIPGVQGSLAILVVHEGNLYARRREADLEIDESLEINGEQGNNFRIKPGDILRSTANTVEFLDVPYRKEANNAQTQFIDLSEMAEIRQGAIREIGRTPPQVEPPQDSGEKTQANILQSPEPEPEPSPLITRAEPLETEAKLPPRPERALDAESSGLSSLPDHEPIQDPIQKPPIQQEYIEEKVEIIYDHAPKSSNKKRIFLAASFLVFFLATASASFLTKFGEPLLAGGAGIVGFGAFAFVLSKLSAITRAKDSFQANTYFTALTALGLLPIAYAIQFHPTAAAVCGVTTLLALLAGYILFLKADLIRTLVLTSFAAGIPTFLISHTSPELQFPFPSTSDPQSVAKEMQAPPVLTPSTSNEQRAPAAEKEPPTTTPSLQAMTLALSRISAPAPSPAVPQALPVAPPVAAAPAVKEIASAPAQSKPSLPAPMKPTTATQSRPAPASPPVLKEFLTAIREGDLQLVRDRINSGAVNPNIVSLNKGRTPLMIAAEEGQSAIVKALLNNKVAVDAKDFNGTTALMLAVIRDHLDVAKILLQHGANPYLKRADGRSAIELAQKGRRRAMIAVLEDGRGGRQVASEKKAKRRR
jgi:hypothetical protein